MIDTLTLLSTALGGGLGIAHLGTAALGMQGLRRHLAARLTATPRPAQAPAAVTLLRPVCGRDAYDAETLASSFCQDHPDHEIIFCVAHADDPVVPLIEALIDAHPDRRARLLIGEDRITGNPKLNNLHKGWCAAEHDVICMADSNIVLPPEYLRSVVTLLDTPGTGLVSAPPAGGRPESWAAHLECAFLNGNQARLQLAADTLGLGFAQGKTLACRRALIDGAGGLAALGGKMAEDVAATHLVRSRDLRVRLMPQPFVQPVGRRTLAEVWARQLRWSIVRRDGFPGLFQLELFNGALVPSLAMLGVLMALGQPVAWMAAWLGAWYAVEVGFLRGRGWPMGWRDLAMLPVRDLMLPLIWIATLRRQQFDWRGNRVAGTDATPSLAFALPK